MYCHIYKTAILKVLMDMLVFHPTCRILGRLTELLATNTGTPELLITICKLPVLYIYIYIHIHIYIHTYTCSLYSFCSPQKLVFVLMAKFRIWHVQLALSDFTLPGTWHMPHVIKCLIFRVHFFCLSNTKVCRLPVSVSVHSVLLFYDVCV